MTRLAFRGQVRDLAAFLRWATAQPRHGIAFMEQRRPDGSLQGRGAMLTGAKYCEGVNDGKQD